MISQTANYRTNAKVIDVLEYASCDIIRQVSEHDNRYGPQSTLGCPGMAPLSCVIFLADSLEPSRGDTPELATLRDLSQQHLYRAVAQTSTYTCSPCSQPADGSISAPF